MNAFERELRSALKRREPPQDFAERVLARIPVPSARRRWFPRSWLPAAAAVLITALGAGSWEYAKARQQRVEAERAKADLIRALQVTSDKLQATRAKLFRSTGGSI